VKPGAFCGPPSKGSRGREKEKHNLLGSVKLEGPTRGGVKSFTARGEEMGPISSVGEQIFYKITVNVG